MNFAKFLKRSTLALIVLFANAAFGNDIFDQADFNGEKMRFVSIKAGEFTMGTPEDAYYRAENEAQVTVKLEQDFEIQTTEVTQLQWLKIMRRNPSYFRREKDCSDNYWMIGGTTFCPNHPVDSVSWDDVQEFITKYNQLKKNDGYTYRLPTRAEWEYVARAGTKTAYFFGDGPSLLSAYAWYSANSDERTHRVGQKFPNPWGLYDIYGNVWEWVQDSGKIGFERGAELLPNNEGRTLCGGGWINGAKALRSAAHQVFNPDGSSVFFGFRLVRIPNS